VSDIIYASYLARSHLTTRAMARDLNFSTEVVIGPTVREHDGLAKSSRNVYLSPEERTVAPILFKALRTSQALYDEHNERSSKALIEKAILVLKTEPSIVLDYFSVADLTTGEEVEQIGPNGALFSTAVKLGKTRLIDNIIFNPK
jgi:pantoate--beta-alanine ligase